MEGEDQAGRSEARGRPASLFLLSFRQRGELAALVAGAGWRVVAARRGEGVARRFLASGAAIAVVDARGALDEGFAALAEIAPVARARGAALLALVSRTDLGAIGRVFDAGATHFLASPFTEAELVQTLRFAWRYAERLSHDEPAPALAAEDPLGWRYDPRARTLRLTPAAAARLELPERPNVRAALRRLGEDRALALAAIRRLPRKGGATAFAHDLPGLGRIVHHVQLDRESSAIHALVETLGTAPDAAAEMTDALGRGRDLPGVQAWVERRLALGEGAAVMRVGLSRFDLVESGYGPAVARALLTAAGGRVAATARRTLGKQVVTAPASTAEYLVAAPGDPDLGAAAAALGEALVRPFALDGALVSVGARVGVAHARPGDDAAALLHRAADALAAAQASEDTSIWHADRPGVGEPAIDALAADLGRAIETGAIALVFQPQVAVGTGQVVGVEALARWEHPVFGEVGAAALFGAAERADLGIALSDHIQRRALAQVARWTGPLAGLRVAVNLTAADIARPGFADLFLDRVDTAGFPRARLTVEVIESGLIRDLGAAAGLLSALRSAGCRTAIDDFGTGYSSLAYLKALPLDYLKIDKKLAQDITGSARDRIVVRGVIDMARSLGLAVIAEGVETPEQLELLAKEGCNFYQGFLCAEPLTEAGLAALLAG